MKNFLILASALTLAACGATAEFRAVENECAALLLKQYPTQPAIKLYAREKEEFQGRIECQTVVDTQYVEVEDNAPPPPRDGKGRKDDRPPPPRTKTVKVEVPRQECKQVAEKFYHPEQFFADVDLYKDVRAAHLNACTAQNCMARFGNVDCKK